MPTSPILAHAGALGRPDHHGLLIALVTLALVAELRLSETPTRLWAILSGIAWGMALWVSFYEPAVLLLGLLLAHLVFRRNQLFGAGRRLGWGVLGGVLLLGLAIERRASFSLPLGDAAFRRWAGAIEELAPVLPWDPVWREWAGWLFPFALLLMLVLAWKRRLPGPPALFILFFLSWTMAAAQARWAGFALLLLAFLLPVLLQAVRRPLTILPAVLLAFLPFFAGWDRQLWPGPEESARRALVLADARDTRQMAEAMRSGQTLPFLAPWWESPAVAYWSGQPGVAGSSHESLPGILATAEFFLTENPGKAEAILRGRGVAWVMAGPADWVLENAAALSGGPAPSGAMAGILARQPGRAPIFLRLVGQNGTKKLYSAQNFP